jgi:hypothetical protein
MRIGSIWLVATPLLFGIPGIAYSEGVPASKKAEIVKEMVRNGEIRASCAKEEEPSHLVDIELLDLTFWKHHFS